MAARPGGDRQRDGRRPRGRGDPRPRRRRAVPASPMFGDEPYGNYNRIMLSHVLAGDEDDGRDLPQPAGLVRRERHHAARRASGSCGSTAIARKVLRRRRHHPDLRQADHRHRQPLVLPADGRHVARRPTLTPGVFGFRTHRRHQRDARLRQEHRTRGRDRRRAARAGGRPRPAEPRPGRARRAGRPAPDEPAARRPGRRASCAAPWRQLGITVHTGGAHDRGPR